MMMSTWHRYTHGILVRSNRYGDISPVHDLQYGTRRRGPGTAGQPTTAQLAAIKDAGYEVIINLATWMMPAISLMKRLWSRPLGWSTSISR